MGMDIVFFLIVMGTAIIGFFSQEFQRLFQHIFSVPGTLLFLPLIFISLLIESHLAWSWAVLVSIHSIILRLETFVASFMSHQSIAYIIARVFILTSIGILPILIVYLYTRKSKISDAMFYAYRLSAVIWVITVILFVSIV